MIKKVIREFFLLSRGEQRGLLVVAFLLLISILIRFIVGIPPAESDGGSSLFIEEARRLLAVIEEKEVSKENESLLNENLQLEEKNYHAFDPNIVSKGELLKMGVPDFASSNMLKYRTAGGYFSSPEDLLKIYGIDSALFISLKPFVSIAGREEFISAEERNNYGESVEEIESMGGIEVQNGYEHEGWAINTRFFPEAIELNSADTSDLKKLPGIGPVFAGRIIKYRELLGGFTDIQQLNEVYGLEAYALSKIDSLVSLNLDLLQTIDLNSATYSQLLRHPYLSKGEVEAILQYRNFAKSIPSTDALFHNISLDSSRWKRLSKYLIADDFNSSSQK